MSLTVAVLADVAGARGGIGIEPPDHVRDIPVDVMVYPVSQRRPFRAGEADFGMNPLAPPNLRPLAEQPWILGLAEIGAPAVAHPPGADVVVDGDAVPVVARGGDDGADFAAERIGHPLVGVDLEYPFAVACLDAGIAAVALDRPVAFDEPVGEARRDLLRPVRALIEKHNDLVSEPEPLETLGKLLFLVMDGDYSGKDARFCGHGRFIDPRLDNSTRKH